MFLRRIIWTTLSSAMIRAVVTQMGIRIVPVGLSRLGIPLLDDRRSIYRASIVHNYCGSTTFYCHCDHYYQNDHYHHLLAWCGERPLPPFQSLWVESNAPPLPVWRRDILVRIKDWPGHDRISSRRSVVFQGDRRGWISYYVVIYIAIHTIVVTIRKRLYRNFRFCLRSSIQD